MSLKDLGFSRRGSHREAIHKYLCSCGKIKEISRYSVSSGHTNSCGCLKVKLDSSKIGNKNPLWKGDSVGYYCMHTWVTRWKGKPSLCEVCGTQKANKFEWANIDHTYKRILDDYIRMCTPCHRKYDYYNHLSDKGSKYGSVKNKIIK